MGTVFSEFNTTQANLLADLKTKILLSADWANITGDIMKATTTRGAQMVVNLNKAAMNTQRLVWSAFRTHNGTTGVDETAPRYLYWKRNTGVSTEVLHCVVSAGKEHLFISVEGPRASEPNSDSVSFGSCRQFIAMSDVVPYFAGDTTPVVAIMGSNLNDGSGPSGVASNLATVSRDQDDSSSWELADLLTVAYARGPGSISIDNDGLYQALAKGDGKYYLWPYMVVEQVDGLRGRLSSFFNAGRSMVRNTGDPYQTRPSTHVGQEVSYGGNTYKLVLPTRSDQQFDCTSAFGGGDNSQVAEEAPLIAVPLS